MRGQTVRLTAGVTTASAAGTPRTADPSRCRPEVAPRLRAARSRGSGAPILTQASKSATTSSASLALGGIWRSLVVVADRLDQQAVVEVAGHDRRPGVAPFAQALPAVDEKSSLDLLGGARSGTWRIASPARDGSWSRRTSIPRGVIGFPESPSAAGASAAGRFPFEAFGRRGRTRGSLREALAVFRQRRNP